MVLQRHTSPPRWRLNPALTIRAFEVGGAGQWLLELDDARGVTQRLAVSSPVRRILDLLRDPCSEADLVARLESQGWSRALIAALRPVVFIQSVERCILIPDRVSARRARSRMGAGTSTLTPERPCIFSLLRSVLRQYANRIARLGRRVRQRIAVMRDEA